MTNHEYDDFTSVEEQGTDKVQEDIRKYVDEIKETVITANNHKNYYDQVVGNAKFISTAIASLNDQQKKHVRKYKAYLDRKDIQSQMNEERIVPKEMLDELMSAFFLERDKYEWQIIYSDLHKILAYKDRDVIGSVNAFDVERQVLERFNEKSAADRELFQNAIASIVKIHSNDMSSALKIYKDETMHEIRKIRDRVEQQSYNVVRKAEEEYVKKEVVPKKETFPEKDYEAVQLPDDVDVERQVVHEQMQNNIISFKNNTPEPEEKGDFPEIEVDEPVIKISKEEYRTEQAKQSSKDFARFLHE